MNLVALVDEYLGEVARLHSPATELKYRQVLKFLLRDLGEKTPTEQITESDLLRSLARWQSKSKATQYLSIQIYDNVFKYAMKKRHLEVNPMQFIERPRRPRPEDTDVVAVSKEEVARMFFACTNWGDEICLGVLAFTGSRRNAVSMIRWKDVDLRPDPPHGPYGWIKLKEKGGKHIEKPIPFLLKQILDRAPVHDPDDYLVPNYRPGAVTCAERKNDIIYRRVKNIAAKAGVEAHVHAIRAAFAVTFLEANRGNIKGLQDLLGHARIETTQTYLRKMSKRESMAGVLDLNYGALNEGVPDASNVGMVPAPSLSALSEGEGGSVVPGLLSGTGPELAKEKASARPVGQTETTLMPRNDQAKLASPSLSALSEGDHLLKEATLAPSLGSHLAPSESALTEEVERGVLGAAWEPESPWSAAVPAATPESSPSSVSAPTMSGHEEVTTPGDPQAQFPCGFEEAHTGFEPVSPRWGRLHQPSTGARHVARHGRPCYSGS